MLNKERLEVIDAMVNILDTSNNYTPYLFKKDTGFEGSVFSKEFREWANSEYVEPFKLSSIQKNILESFEPTLWIARDSNDNLELYMTEPEMDCGKDFWKEDCLYVIDVYNQLFPFIHKMETYQVEYILNNCEVVE